MTPKKTGPGATPAKGHSKTGRMHNVLNHSQVEKVRRFMEEFKGMVATRNNSDVALLASRALGLPVTRHNVTTLRAALGIRSCQRRSQVPTFGPVPTVQQPLAIEAITEPDPRREVEREVERAPAPPVTLHPVPSQASTQANGFPSAQEVAQAREDLYENWKRYFRVLEARERGLTTRLHAIKEYEPYLPMARELHALKNRA